MKVLVTGAAGFIGSHLTERLLALGHDVTGIDCFTDYYPAWIKQWNVAAFLNHPRFRLVQGDLTELELAPLLEEVQWVFHQAAQAGVRASWGASFNTYLKDNVLATQRLLEAAKGTALQKLVYASSSSIYGDAETFPTPETTLPRPVSPYGVTKLAAEHLCHLYYRNYGVPAVALRYFTVYGPRQRPDMAFHIFARALLRGEPIRVYGDGLQTRDFTYIEDAVTANVLAAQQSPTGEVYNIGGGSRVTLQETLNNLEKITGLRAIVQHEPAQRGDARHTSADIQKAGRLLGYRPAIGIAAGLANEVAWMEDLLAEEEKVDFGRAAK